MILLTLILIIKVLIVKNKEMNNTKTTTLLLTCVVILTTMIEIIKALIITKITIIVIIIIDVVNKILITSCESENGDMQYRICKLRLSEIIVKITGIYQLRGTFISGTDKWEMPNLLKLRPIKASILEVAYLVTMLH